MRPPNKVGVALNRNRHTRSFWQRFKVEIVIVVVGLIATNLIFIAKAFRQSTTIDREAASQLGSFVGGYVGATFALIGVVLLFSTLRTQQRAFAQQSFENKYFELLKMHRGNVEEIKIKKVSGRRVFVLMLEEFRCALEIVRKIARSFEQQPTQRELLQVTYYCLFYGVGPNSSRMLKTYLSTFNSAFVDAVEKELNRPEIKDAIREQRGFNYVPFQGHQSRLGHYYRHLYQMVRYVDQQVIDINKYEYVKTIRAQLSTHEQALLLLNSLTPIGQNWWNYHLIDEYRLVKNIPREFFDSLTEINTSKLFKTGYFEWEELHTKEDVI